MSAARSTSDIRIGVDLGGTKIETAAIDQSGTVLWRQRVPTPHGDYAGTIEAIATLVSRVERELGVSGRVGVGTPGSVSPTTGLHRNSNSTVLNGRPFVGDLAARLGREIRTANDANCFSLSEARTGAARGARVVFGVILGTGVGGGIVVDGRAMNGHNGIAGEWGHSPMPETDRAERAARPCYCGLFGCREQFLSGPAVEREYESLVGVRLRAEELARRATDDPLAAETIARYCERLARSLADVVNLLDPDSIVLGGGLSNLRALFERVPPRVASLVFSDSFTTPIVAAQHGDSSGVLGAAMLWE